MTTLVKVIATIVLVKLANGARKLIFHKGTVTDIINEHGVNKEDILYVNTKIINEKKQSV